MEWRERNLLWKIYSMDKWPRLALLALSVSVAGCQSAGSVGDRPILPLVSSIDAPPTFLRASLGPPIELTKVLDVTPISNVQPTKEKPGVDQKGMKEIPPIPSVTPDQILRACFSQEQPIDLSRAFGMANLDNPIIGLADEVVRANLAEQTLARSLLFPTLNLGTTLSMHRGSLQSGAGAIRDVDRESLYYGAGSDVRGAGTVAVPGVHVVSHLGDAVLAPRVAAQKVQRSRFDAAATQNAVLLDVANAYLALVGSEARLLALLQSEKEILEVATLTTNFANKGLGRESDALRSQSELSLLQSTIQRTEEDVVARATELARLVSADPTVRLRPEPGSPPIIQLVDERGTLESLLETAIANRPEVAARDANVAMNESRLRQERVRPFLPTISVGFSAGDFGGGSNLAGYRFSHFNSRTDFDVLAVWTVQNLGMGNRAVQNHVRAEIGMAEAQRMQAIDQVHREVTEAFTQARASRHQLDIAKRRVETAQQAFRQDLLRTKDRLGNLIEVMSSFNMLTTARQDLIHAMVEYSQSQFQLHVALGGTPAVPQADVGKK